MQTSQSTHWTVFFFFLLSQSHFSLGDWQVLAPGLLKVSGSFSELAWRQITCQSKWVAGNHTRTHTKCRHSGTWRRPGEKKLSKTFQTQLMFLSTFQDQTYYLHQGNTCINHGPLPFPERKMSLNGTFKCMTPILCAGIPKKKRKLWKI